MLRTSMLIVGGTTLMFMAANYASKLEAAENVCEANGKIADLHFTVKDINGKDVALSAFKGNVILLDFWATWCPSCKKEIPGFIGLYNTHKSRGFVVLGVSVDDSISDVKKFVKQFKMNYPLLVGHDREDLKKPSRRCPAFRRHLLSLATERSGHRPPLQTVLCYLVAGTGMPFAAIKDSSSATVSGNGSPAPPRTPPRPTPRAISSGVLPSASFTCKSAPFSARNFTKAVKPLSAAPWTAV